MVWKSICGGRGDYYDDAEWEVVEGGGVSKKDCCRNGGVDTKDLMYGWEERWSACGGVSVCVGGNFFPVRMIILDKNLIGELVIRGWE